MKILHLNNYDKKGGAETVFNITVEELENKKGFINYKGFVSILNEKKSDIQFKNWEENNKILGALNYIFSYSNYRELFKFLKENDLDIVHIHGFLSSLSPSILLAIKKYKKINPKIKILQTVHDFHPTCPNSALFNYSKNEICESCIGKKYKLDIFLKNCDRRGRVFSIIKGIRSIISNNLFNQKEVINTFIVPSEFLGEKLRLDGVSKEKITLVKNPIKIIDKEINKIKNDEIVYFGRFSKEKNLVFLIQAFSKWKSQKKNDFKLVLIGEGEEEESLKEAKKKSKVSEDIIFLPFMTFDKLADRLKKSKVSVMPSKWYETFGLTIYESVFFDIIPIVRNIGAMKESIDYLEFGYSFNTENELIRSLNEATENYQDQIVKILECKLKIKNELSPKNYLDKLIEIYKKEVRS